MINMSFLFTINSSFMAVSGIHSSRKCLEHQFSNRLVPSVTGRVCLFSTLFSVVADSEIQKQTLAITGADHLCCNGSSL